MLDYASDRMTCDFAFDRVVGAGWEMGGMPDGSVLSCFMAASRTAPSMAKRGMPAGFQPERMSGFCAT